jgi:deoxyadenosine/deoxycytidine kinase
MEQHFNTKQTLFDFSIFEDQFVLAQDFFQMDSSSCSSISTFDKNRQNTAVSTEYCMIMSECIRQLQLA